MNERLKFLKIALYVIVAIILVRLFQIQIIQKSDWVAKAEAQHTLENTIKAKRGQIYMMDGSEAVAVVMNEQVYTVIVDPMTAKEEEIKEVIFNDALKENLTTDFDKVFEDKTRRYFIVAKNVSRKNAKMIQEKNPTGVWLQERTKRVYPEGPLAARLLGFVNEDGEGQYGVEGSLNEELSGKDGRLKTVADVNNVALSIGKDNVKIPAVDGKNVVLTIDRNIQAKAEEIVKDAMEETGKDHASALVMNPRNGEIMAMVDLPGYDPADYGNVSDASVYVNGVVNDPYEPASVCKAFTFAAGIEEGVMSADTTYYNQDTIYIDGWPISNASKNGDAVRTMQYALNWSLNVGSIQVLKWLGGDEDNINEKGRKILYDYYVNKFGLGRETGIELFEAEGLINDPVEGYGRDSLYANMTFGQNMLVTMIQVASGYSAMVNGGEYYTPTVVKGYIENGKLIQKEKAGPVRRAISEETSEEMRDMLYGTRDTGWYGEDPGGYRIGGKTGSAQVIRDGAYVMDESVATYIGFGGATGELPEYLIMVRIWKDGELGDAIKEAEPMFSEISDYLIDYLKIKPGD